MAAERPAGPAPTMMTSTFLLAMVVLGSGRDLGLVVHPAEVAPRGVGVARLDEHVGHLRAGAEDVHVLPEGDLGPEEEDLVHALPGERLELLHDEHDPLGLGGD